MTIEKQHIFGARPHVVYIVGEAQFVGTDFETVREALAGVTIPAEDLLGIVAQLEQWAGVSYTAEEKAALARQNMVRVIDEWDDTEAVNSFELSGMAMWLDKSTRIGLLGRLRAEEAMGLEETTLWYGAQCIALPLQMALQMLFAIEVYASQCYDATQAHKAAVAKMATAEEIVAYDYKSGYPEKLVF